MDISDTAQPSNSKAFRKGFDIQGSAHLIRFRTSRLQWARGVPELNDIILAYSPSTH
jgi:hypothetical protein